MTLAQQAADRRVFSYDGLLLVVALAFTAALNLTPIYSSDFWIQLKVGDLIRDEGEIPHTIRFAFGAARDFEFLAYEWLPSLLSSQIFSWIGYEGMIFVKCGLSLVVFALVAALCHQVARNATLSILLAAVCMLGLNYRTQMRPELYGWICFLGSLNLIHAYLRTRRIAWLVAMLPVSVFWANCHGSLLIGLVLPGIFATGILVADGWQNTRQGAERSDWSRSRALCPPLFGICVALALVSLANPFGFQLLEHVFTLSQSAYIKENIAEWRPIHDPGVLRGVAASTYVFFLAASLSSVAVGAARLTPTLALLCLIFGALPFSAHRHLSWFVMIACYLMAHTLEPSTSRSSRRALAYGGAFLLLVGLVVVIRVGNVRGHTLGLRSEAPLNANAIEFIRDRGMTGNVFNSYHFGDQLAYHFHPRIRVAIDSRVDAYGEAYYRAFRSMSGRSYKRLGEPDELIEFLEENDVDWIILRHFDYGNWQVRGNAAHLRVGGWKEIYRDSEALILERSQPAD